MRGIGFPQAGAILGAAFVGAAIGDYWGQSLFGAFVGGGAIAVFECVSWKPKQ